MNEIHTHLRHRAVLGALCVLLALAAVNAPGAHAATVGGTVRDGETGDIVDYATILLIGETPQGGEVRRGAMAGPDGVFVLESVPLGRYLLRYTRVGYQLLEDSLEVSADREYRLAPKLIAQPVEVEEIVVEADRYQRVKDVQTGFLNFDADALARLPGVVEGDPIRTLQLLPGVQTASDFASGLYVRGGGPDQTLVLLDDVTVYNATHAFGFFSSFNADALDAVNLYKGAYPADYGGRLGAVLDVRSRAGNRNEVVGKAGASTIASRVAVDGPVGNGTWMLSGRRTYLDPILDAIRSEDNEIPSYYFYDLNGKVTYPLGQGTLTLNAYKGRDDLGLDLDADTEISLNWGNELGSAVYQRPLGKNVVWRLRGSGSEYESLSGLRIFTTPIELTNRIREFTVETDATWFVSDNVRMDAGVLGHTYDIIYQQRFNGELQVDYGRSPWEAATFIDTEWKPDNRTVTRTGLRVRYIDDGSRVLWEPRLSVARGLSEKVRVKLGGGLYHQYLQLVSTEGFSAADFYVPIDQTADPGRSWQLVTGVEYQPVLDYRFSAETYFTGLSDLVQFNTRLSGDSEETDAEDLFYTDGEGYATGVELFAEKRRGPLTGWVGYTLGWTRRTFEDLNQGERFAPKYDRRHDINAVAQYRSGKWTYGATFVFATGQAFTPGSARYALRNPATGELTDELLLPASRNSARLLPYHRLDVSVGRTFQWLDLGWEWYLQVFNVYNRRNEWFVQYDLEDPFTDPDVVKMLPIIPSLGINFDF